MTDSLFWFAFAVCSLLVASRAGSLKISSTAAYNVYIHFIDIDNVIDELIFPFQLSAVMREREH